MSTLEWRYRIALQATLMFTETKEAHSEISIALGKRPSRSPWRREVKPFTGQDLVYLLEKTGWPDPWSHIGEIQVILHKMVSESILTHIPESGNLLFLHGRFITIKPGTRAQRNEGGRTWLASTLGSDLIADELHKSTVMLVVADQDGNEQVGSGLAIGLWHLLTCNHVIDQMQSIEVHDYLNIAGKPRIGTQVYRDPDEDVAVVEISPNSGSSLNPINGLCWRRPKTLDSVVIAGYPYVPTTRQAALTMHAGEVSNASIASMQGERFLYTATARPGNSGGPIISSDGRFLGIVQGSPNLQSVTSGKIADQSSNEPLLAPYYMGIPSHVIANCLKKWDFPKPLIPNSSILEGFLPEEDWA